ncbi:exodeoxyribonuclease III [Endozoicomonas sp. (ex Bugula neritina AB1)]|nr:exodeoxyribonuclease III [Endozoicomonas sp. (ex Bugula neritina AB1)]
MKIVTFNVNGLRARLHQLETLMEKYSPDIIGLQEIKVSDEDFPVKAIEDLGYEVIYHGQKTHYGVAILSKQPSLNAIKGFPTDSEDAQKRLILATFDLPNGKSVKVINGYFPQGENRAHETKFPAKEKFYKDLQSYLNEHCSPSENLVVMGDFNISHTDMDIGIGPDNAKRWLRSGKCSFLPEEREWFNHLLSWGLHDSFRISNPNNTLYSWFDYRSRGFDREPRRGLRIDGILATESLQQHCRSVVVDYDIRGMDKPSDHAPVIAEYDL